MQGLLQRALTSALSTTRPGRMPVQHQEQRTMNRTSFLTRAEIIFFTTGFAAASALGAAGLWMGA